MKTPRYSAFMVLVAVVLVTGCGNRRSLTPPANVQADEFLFQRGQEELKDRKWLQAREYFRQIVDNYPQSTFRPDAKLAVGDTYMGEDTTESLLLAVNEFREFLTFYPTNPRADYAQFQLSKAYMEQMLAPDRDQSATRDAVKELQVFVDRYPNSKLMPEARTAMREAKDRLSDSSYRIGLTYFKMKWDLGAIARFREVLKNDPEFTRRDAVYFHLAESLARTGDAGKKEALPYYERLVKEFEQSEYLDKARRRIAELNPST